MDRQEAFIAVFDEHFDAIVAFARRRLRDHAMAEEIAADVFRIAWEKFDERDPFRRPWLIRTALNRIREFYRREKRRTSALEALVENLDTRSGLDELEKQWVRSAVLALNGRQREVVLLTYWEDLSAEEVALVLHCHAGAVWTALSRAREALRVAMSDVEMRGVITDGKPV